MSSLDLDDSRPSYLQVADRIRAQITAGGLAGGDPLPTHKELAETYEVGTETVKRALGLLRAEGVIVTRQGKGSYVRGDQADAGAADSISGADALGAIDQLRAEIASVKRRLDALEAGRRAE